MATNWGRLQETLETRRREPQHDFAESDGWFRHGGIQDRGNGSHIICRGAGGVGEFEVRKMKKESGSVTPLSSLPIRNEDYFFLVVPFLTPPAGRAGAAAHGVVLRPSILAFSVSMVSMKGLWLKAEGTPSH